MPAILYQMHISKHMWSLFTNPTKIKHKFLVAQTAHRIHTENSLIIHSLRKVKLIQKQKTKKREISKQTNHNLLIHGYIQEALQSQMIIGILYTVIKITDPHSQNLAQEWGCAADLYRPPQNYL